MQTAELLRLDTLANRPVSTLPGSDRGRLGSAENLSLVYQHPLTEISGPRGPVKVPG